MEQLEKQFNELVEQHGADKVQAMFEALTARFSKVVPLGYYPILNADNLSYTCKALDAGIADIADAGQPREELYQRRAELLKLRESIKAEVDIDTATAFMEIKGEGKTAYVEIGDERISVTNEKARDAYAKTTTAEQRKKLAEVEGELAQIGSELDKHEKTEKQIMEANHNIRAKAQVQAALLQYLAGGAK